MIKRELEELKRWRKHAVQLKRDKEMTEAYTKTAPQASYHLSAEKRQRLYQIVLVNPDRGLELSGALETQLVQSGLLPLQTPTQKLREQ